MTMNDTITGRTIAVRSDGRGVARWAAVALVALLAAAPAQAAEERLTAEESKEMATGAGVGAAAGLSSVVYAPAKVVYALGGSVVAGLAYVLSGGDEEVAKPILDASVRGDYVVTPDHIQGKRPLDFVGRPAGDRPLESAVSSAPPEGTGESWK
jgi:hypothetical protein